MKQNIKKEYVRGYTPVKCYSEFIVIVILISLAITAPYLAYLKHFMPFEENICTWFQRSGSVTVLLSLTAEYIISHLHGIISPSGFTSNETEIIRKKIETPLMFCRYIGGLVAIVGTIIWGYGDLFI